MSALDSLRLASRNSACRWSFGDTVRDNEPGLAINRIENGYFQPRFSPKFKLGSEAAFFAIGSCFAREIETALLRRGRKVNSRIFEIEGNPDFPVTKGTTTIFDLFNRYNVPSIALEIKNLSPSADLSLGETLIYERSPGLFDDLHYTAAAEPADFETIMRRRAWLRQRLSQGYREADVIVITLGLAEAWFDHLAGKYVNVISSPQMLKKYDTRMEVRTIGVMEAFSHLKEALELMKQDGKKVIITVSPVPLQVTFQDKDVVVSNAEAKSILRALCAEVSKDDPNVDYFPSFEMVTFSETSLAWRPDRRHVQMAMVEKIMETAIDHYLN